MSTFAPRLDLLPPSQRDLWPELSPIRDQFILYGGTALALRLGHRTSVDFDFFAFQPFDMEILRHSVSISPNEFMASTSTPSFRSRRSAISRNPPCTTSPPR
jgi:hypothetical protein